MTDEHDERRANPRRQQDIHNDAMAQNIAALAALVEATSNNVSQLSEEVRGLRKAIVPRKAIIAEANRLATARRRGIAAVCLFAVALIWAHDEHVEHCSPGARSEVALEVLIDNADKDRVDLADEIVAVLNGDEQPKFCDASFPLHDHDGNGWPRFYNVLGILGWGTFATALWFWVRRAPRDSAPPQP